MSCAYVKAKGGDLRSRYGAVHGHFIANKHANLTGARISEPRFEALEGHLLNVLLRGRRYIFAYEVIFKKDAKAVLFSVLISSKTGLELGGRRSFSRNEKFPHIAKDAAVTGRHEFDCSLATRAYFVKVGVSDGERRSLHRIMNAFMFRWRRTRTIK